MRPANSYTDGFRFESDNMAKALTFDSGATAGEKWVDQIYTLAGGRDLVLTGAMALLITLV